MNSLIRRFSQPAITKIHARRTHSNAEFLTLENVENRNPRNLELLRIARKPAGWHLEKPGREFWHKLIVTKTFRHVTVEIIHCENGSVLSASTKEWAIKKYLYKMQDRAAYFNLGRVMAQRCLESGIMNVRCDIEAEKCEKMQLLLEEIQKGGVALTEPERYKKPFPWDPERPEKPWEIHE